MLKKACIVLGLVVAAAAFGALIQGTRGRGVAVNDRHVSGHFAMDVKKATDGHHVEIGGHMVWESFNRNTHTGVRIEMRRAHEYFQEGNAARFAGPAVATFVRDGHRIVQHGRLAVQVRDNRDPHHPSNVPDTIALRFVSDTAPGPYEFAGHVREGDIDVYALERK